MCSIDLHGNCTNWYCSCPSRVYEVHLNKTQSWLEYVIEDRPWWNRVIGWFINLKRKPLVYPPSRLSAEELKLRKSKTDEMRRKYGLLEDKDIENINSDVEQQFIKN